MLAEPCNTSVKFNADQSRHAAMNLRLRALNKPEIPFPSPDASAYNATTYSSKYSFKDDFQSTMEKLLGKLAAISSSPDGSQNGLTVLRKVLNAVTGYRSSPITRSCLYLLEPSEFIASYTTTTLKVRLYKNMILQNDNATQEGDLGTTIQMRVDENSDIVTYTECDDYLYRNDKLEDLSPFKMKALSIDTCRPI